VLGLLSTQVGGRRRFEERYASRRASELYSVYQIQNDGHVVHINIQMEC